MTSTLISGIIRAMTILRWLLFNKHYVIHSILFVLVFYQFHFHAKHESRSLILPLRIDIYSATRLLDDSLADGKTHAYSFQVLVFTSRKLTKGYEQFALVISADAYSAIFYVNFEEFIIVVICRLYSHNSIGCKI